MRNKIALILIWFINLSMAYAQDNSMVEYNLVNPDELANPVFKSGQAFLLTN